MRSTGRSVRRRFLVMLLVPLLPLTAVWVFATALTSSAAQRALDAAHAVDQAGRPVGDTVRALQAERAEALRYLADRRRADATTALRARTRATDAALRRLRQAAAPGARAALLPPAPAGQLRDLLGGLASLPALRSQVERNTVDRQETVHGYDSLLASCFDLLAGLLDTGDATLARQNRAVTGMARSREELAQEDALMSAAFLSGTMTADDLKSFSDAAVTRDYLQQTALPQVPAAEQDRYASIVHSSEAVLLASTEDRVVAAGAAHAPRATTPAQWRAQAGSSLDALARLDDAAAAALRARARHAARVAVVEAGACGVLGLAALSLALLVSYRVGRRHVKDLTALRDTALEISSVRLPHVMRRLAAGQEVDVAVEAPFPRFGPDETGQVGYALGTLHRAAVEAAVRQAQMRRGVSEVFVNLARRSQVLLHRQLRLLDTMERRTEDTGELADLFLLDHLTTRMRRHAEGLVILSGAPASRQWRRPVPLMDVVRAALAEVEDYARVEVRGLPRLTVDGSAVADLTHLVAELLENATVFSPPDTVVQVRGEQVPNGFALEIHDRGLGMTPAALIDANLRLAETPEFELSDTDRLGLFVVSRLARRQNARVTLQPSGHGGITAVVLLPGRLLRQEDGATPVEDGPASRSETPQQVGPVLDGLAGALARARAALPNPPRPGPAAALPSRGGKAEAQPPAQPLPAAAAPDGAFEDRPPRPDATVAPAEAHGAPPEAPRHPGDEASAPSGQHQQRADAAGHDAAPRPRRTLAGPGAPEPRTPSGLPRRVRQASLAAGLKDTPEDPSEPTAARPVPAQADHRAADAARVRMAALQRGWTRARSSDDADGAEPTGGAEAAAHQHTGREDPRQEGTARQRNARQATDPADTGPEGADLVTPADPTTGGNPR